MSTWDWRIRSYRGDVFMLETVHRGDVSRDMELQAIEACGRRAEVTPLSDEAREQWRNGWRPPAAVAR